MYDMVTSSELNFIMNWRREAYLRLWSPLITFITCMCNPGRFSTLSNTCAMSLKAAIRNRSNSVFWNERSGYILIALNTHQSGSISRATSFLQVLALDDVAWHPLTPARTVYQVYGGSASLAREFREPSGNAAEVRISILKWQSVPRLCSACEHIEVLQIRSKVTVSCSSSLQCTTRPV